MVAIAWPRPACRWCASIRARPTTHPPAPWAGWPRPLHAQVLARFAAEVRPPLRPQPSAVVEDLQILSRRRRNSNWWRIARPTSSGAATPPAIWIWASTPCALRRTAALAQVERQLAALIGGADAARHLAAEHPRDRPRGRRQGLAEVPELGTSPASRSPPWSAPRQSRQRRPARRSCWGGRAQVRTALYMAALTATRHNPRSLLPAPPPPASGQGLVASLRKPHPPSAARDHLGPHHALTALTPNTGALPFRPEQTSHAAAQPPARHPR